MKAPGLIFIPDISGFTALMNDISLEVAVEVLPDLLNSIISANRMDLRVAEIEGDAILFYRTGAPPTLDEVVGQCQVFCHEFRQRLVALRDAHSFSEISRGILLNLGLKFIVHYGDFTALTLRERVKLVGREVVVAHRLLKNQVDCTKYVLFTESFLTASGNTLLPDLLSGADTYEHIGRVAYQYLKLIR